MTQPHTPSSTTETGVPNPPCGLPRRLLVMLYDTVLVIALLIIAGIIALPFTGTSQQAGRDVLYTLYLVAVWFGYVSGCWIHAGGTVGMRAWKVRLASTTGEPMDWRRAGIRFVVSLLSAAIFGLGFLTGLLRADRACWHDRASGTRLVRRAPKSDRAA
ncbi:RDD family protein [Marinihelvus fidelis]|uniref:RDD family protein n=1 Tax=Marinihelvus fidelis TaxID=2613842 RepID=A0A5N0TAC7_9GAMM|nr:RDD family protein [Marinihelvus fidelis]KAA9130786.1 RDD family protein [Marinihelvus fidelis]